MGRRIMAIATTVLSGVLIAGLPLSASAVEADGGRQPIITSGRASGGVSPLAEAFPAEGGTWQYGRNVAKAWSNYYHPNRVHASTVKANNTQATSPNTAAGKWSYATMHGWWLSASYYYRVL